MSQLYVDEIFGGTEASPTLQSKINDLELKKTTLSSGPNHAIGTNALSSIVNGENNIAIGENALLSNTGTGPTSGKNIAIGDNSMSNNITGNQNIAIGKDSLVNCNAGESNIAIGNQAMLGAASPLEGNDANIAIGNSALYSIDAYGSLNVSVGVNSGFNITNGNRNTFLGSSSGRIASPSMNGSTFVGHQSGESATGNFCTSVGYQAGFSGGEQGTYVGSEAGENSTGIQNVCIGAKAGLHLTTGERNVLIGPYAGSNQDFPVDGIQTGSNNIVLQTGVGDFDLGTDISNAVVLGSTSQTAIYAGVTTITALSDARDKKDVKEISAGLDFIKELKPVDFIWDERKESGKRDIKDCGFLAQDLKEAEDKHGVADYLRLVDDRNPEKLLASYGRLLPVMVKAIQELSQELELLKSK